SLLASLLIRMPEPLLRNLLQRISRDEARHMKFAYAVSGLEPEELSPARRRRMEEILFEAAWAAAASLVAVPTWEEFGLDVTEARSVTGGALGERGIFSYYPRVVARQLARRGFPADNLGRVIERHLEARLRESI